ncbi:MAG: helix-turn-helix transcriptional regulator [Saprospiraceae bacterium]|nr:helix-turn-helix transcriptional regulator [Saprospiraceae bacterium]
MEYKQYEVSEDLAQYVKCYWTLELADTEPKLKQNIMPDGCMEMIFHYGDLYKQYVDQTESVLQPRSFVFGQITRPLEIEPTGRIGVFAVRFQPDGFMPFAPMNVEEMNDKATPLEVLFGQDGINIERAVLGVSEITQRVQIIEEFLMKKLVSDEVRNRIVKSSVDLLLVSKGQLSVSELSGQLQISPRYLEKKFSSAIGISPKQLTKIIRLQAALKMMQQKQYATLTALAYESGYYDQAHFIKDFKEFAGTSPKEFYKDNLKLSALFIGEG